MGKSTRQRKKKLERWRRRQGAIIDELELVATGATMRTTGVGTGWGRKAFLSSSVRHSVQQRVGYPDIKKQQSSRKLRVGR